jgi:hypothetical protein
MDTSDDFATQYAGLIGPQSSADDMLANLRAAQFRPTPAATFPDAPSRVPAAPSSLPIPPSQPPMWLLPDGSVSYTGRPPGSSADAPGNNNPLSGNALTLMALGGGIAQGGIGRGLTQAASAAEADRNRQAQQLNLLQTYTALTNGGVPPQEARLAVSNPSVMRAVAMKYFGPKAQANAPAAPPSIPSLPPGVPNDAAYSPSRATWRAPDGALFNWQGQKVSP